MLSSIENLVNNAIAINYLPNGDFINDDTTIGNKGVAQAQFICQPNSHAFANRTIALDKPVRVGRSVGVYRSTVNNGIFDCKVLSRNHALLWFANDRFFLKDTKSSNGTFVNRERLSKTGDESPDREIFSGDMVQFGVDVLENTKNVTHGCIVATLKLYLPDGREAKPPQCERIIEKSGGVCLDDLYQLNEYVQEASQRERILESKMSALRGVLEDLKKNCDMGKKAIISNNSLLSRVELLEAQLSCYTKKYPDDKLRNELRALQEDKAGYQDEVKKHFRKLTDDKIEALQKCQNLTRALATARSECSDTRNLMDSCEKELRELAFKYNQMEANARKSEVLQTKSDNINSEILAALTSEKEELREKVNLQEKLEEKLNALIKELEVKLADTKKEVSSLRELLGGVNANNCLIDLYYVGNHPSEEVIHACSVIKNKLEEKLEKLTNEANCTREHAMAKENESALLKEKLSELANNLINNRAYSALLEQNVRSLEKKLEICNSASDIIEYPMISNAISSDIARENDDATLSLNLRADMESLLIVNSTNERLEIEMNQIQDEIHACQLTLSNCSSTLNAKNKKISSVRKQLSNLNSWLETLPECSAPNLKSDEIRQKVKDADSAMEEDLIAQLSECRDVIATQRTAMSSLVRDYCETMRVANLKITSLQEAIENMSLLKENVEKDAKELSNLISRENVEFLEIDEFVRNINLNCAQLSLEFEEKMRNNARLLTERKVASEENLRKLELENENLKMKYEELEKGYRKLASLPRMDLWFAWSVMILVFICFLTSKGMFTWFAELTNS